MLQQAEAGKRKRGPGGAHVTELVTLCQVPFLLTPKAKAQVLLVEAALHKQEQMRASGLAVRVQGFLRVLTMCVGGWG